MSAEIQSYRDLVVWQKAMILTQQVYELSKPFPPSEQFGLTNQMRRSSVSIPSNIAEDSGRGSTQDYIRFLYIARGSLFEVQTQFELANKLSFSTQAYTSPLLDLCNEIERMLNSLITKLSKFT